MRGILQASTSSMRCARSRITWVAHGLVVVDEGNCRIGAPARPWWVSGRTAPPVR